MNSRYAQAALVVALFLPTLGYAADPTAPETVIGSDEYGGGPTMLRSVSIKKLSQR